MYLDEGSGEFEGTETEVLAFDDFSSINDGVIDLEFMADDPNVEVDFGAPKTYFVLIEATVDASAQTPSSFEMVHQTEGTSEADDASAEIPLVLEYAANVGTDKVDTALTSASCKAPFDLDIPADVGGGPLEITGELTCTPARCSRPVATSR